MATFKIDIDGVLRDVITSLCEIYNKEFGTNLTKNDITKYKVDMSFPLVKEKLGYSAVQYFFEEHSTEVFLNSGMLKNADIAIKKLRDAGHHIIIVSYQRSYKNKKDTLEWLYDNNIKYDDICFTDKKYLIKGDYLIDDNLEFLVDQMIHDNKTNCICINAPYNKTSLPHHFNRYNSLNDFVDDYLKSN